MAMVMFMVDALQFFDGMPKEEIKKIAFEIAMHGNQGIDLTKTITESVQSKAKHFQVITFWLTTILVGLWQFQNALQLQLPYDDNTTCFNYA